jgi:hypothetical protein
MEIESYKQKPTKALTAIRLRSLLAESRGGATAFVGLSAHGEVRLPFRLWYIAMRVCPSMLFGTLVPWDHLRTAKICWAAT